ncbi:MAG: hypothetical protein DDT21_01865 [Syntrophomonadaceae bacterium]|nr:hypothetical protein [Bacillota bacterium]
MPIRSFILALYLFIAALLLLLLFPAPAHAVNWNSGPALAGFTWSG